jgi:hypothetical protein
MVQQGPCCSYHLSLTQQKMFRIEYEPGSTCKVSCLGYANATVTSEDVLIILTPLNCALELIPNDTSSPHVSLTEAQQFLSTPNSARGSIHLKD